VNYASVEFVPKTNDIITTFSRDGFLWLDVRGIADSKMRRAGTQASGQPMVCSMRHSRRFGGVSPDGNYALVRMPEMQIFIRKDIGAGHLTTFTDRGSIR